MSFTTYRYKTAILYIFLSYLLSALPIQAQTIDNSAPDFQSDKVTDYWQLDEVETQESSLSQLWDDLSRLRTSPLDINTATPEQLQEIPFLTPEQIQAIADYRIRFGGFRSVDELRLVKGFNRRTILETSPYLICSDLQQPEITRRSSHEIIVHANRCLNLREGYRDPTPSNRLKNKAYVGDPWHQSVRYRFDSGSHWTAGILIDKDAGEAYTAQFPYADAVHAFVQWHGHGKLRAITIGHYRLRIGCGLLMNQQFGLNKTFYSDLFMNARTRISPHAATDEYNYLQGAAAQIQLSPRLSAVPFASIRSFDGTLTNDTITAVKTDGLHNVQREMDKRRTFILSTYGLSLKYRHSWFEIEANGLYQMWNRDLYPPIRRYNANRFRGHQLVQSSLSYEMMRYGIRLKGEMAYSGNGGLATIHALTYTIGETIKLMGLYRRFGKHYQQTWGSTFSESSDLQGEQGVFIQASMALSPHWNLDIMGDYFRLSLPQFSIDRPSTGYEVSSRVSYALPKLNVQATYRIKLKQKNNKEMEGTNSDDASPLMNSYKQALTLTATYGNQRTVQWNSKCQMRTYSDPVNYTSMGYAVSQTATWHPQAWPLKTSVTATWFRTDDYNSRVYASERNLLYGFNIPVLYGSGVRTAACLSYKIGKHLTTEAKWAWTHYDHQEVIGSGLQAIKGNNKHDIWIQMRYKW